MSSRPQALPRATIRLQLHKEFGFDDVSAIAPYLAMLGISHVYASPFLMARPGSTHGYDITDHNRLNPELGDMDAFERMIGRLHAGKIGLILDFVPNHMGVGNDNPWWMDVLEWGEASPFARFFDIDWTPADPTLRGRVLLPVLGDHYGAILEKGELQLAFEAERGAFVVRYYDQRFPIAVGSYGRLLRRVREAAGNDAGELDSLIDEFEALRADLRSVRQQAVIRQSADRLKTRLASAAAIPAITTAIDRTVRKLNGTPGDPGSFRDLHGLLEAQSYRLAFWRVATAEINYRRFFDINDLAGLRMEEPELFEVSHRLVFRLIAEGKLQGLRLDHVDGLFDPVGYCRQLQDRTAYLLPQETTRPGDEENAEPAVTTRAHTNPLYLLVEKILARHEKLRSDWPVDGTTGYEFMNQLNGLFIDPRAERALGLLYRRFTGRSASFEDMAIEAKRLIVETSLASEVTVLTGLMHALARQSWATRDFTFSGIRKALVGIITRFPVYRTYITASGPVEEDRRYLDWATAQARKASREADISVFDFLHAVLTTDLAAEGRRGYRPDDVLRTAMKFQQLTGPVMAKAIEDTAFYRYFRLASLNEVGGDPTQFGISVSAFHYLNRERLKTHPFTLLATATHDHKRGEDTRLRIDAISELAAPWIRGVRRWNALNRFHRKDLGDTVAPDPNDEYLIYQTLLGVWPADWAAMDAGARQVLADRIVAYLMKAVREAKLHSSWTQPDTEYETALESFVRAVLDPSKAGAFQADFDPIARAAAVVAACHGLAQTLLKTTVPGVPDIYQGTDFWDFSLVDPDNRRPVDYEARRTALEQIPSADPAALLTSWTDGRIKQFVLGRVLALRRARPALFADGTYEPLEVRGAHADRLVTFRRRLGDEALIVIAPRLVAPLIRDRGHPGFPPDVWEDTVIDLGEDTPSAGFTDIFTGKTVSARMLAVGGVLSPLPVACLAVQGG